MKYGWVKYLCDYIYIYIYIYTERERERERERYIYVCMYVYIYIYICTHIDRYIHIHTYICTHIYTHTHIYISTFYALILKCQAIIPSKKQFLKIIYTLVCTKTFLRLCNNKK